MMCPGRNVLSLDFSQHGPRLGRCPALSVTQAAVACSPAPAGALAGFSQGRGEQPEAGADRHLQTLTSKKESGLVQGWGLCHVLHPVLTVHLGNRHTESCGRRELT